MSDLHAGEINYGTGKKKFSVYLIGFVLCVLLTLIPFKVVMSHTLPVGQIFAIIFASAIVQFFVQVICFLRLNTQSEEGKMNVMSFVFTIVILLAVVVGSLWIMWNLNYNMMN